MKENYDRIILYYYNQKENNINHKLQKNMKVNEGIYFLPLRSNIQLSARYEIKVCLL